MPMDANHFFQIFRLTATNHDQINIGDRLHAIFIRGDNLMIVA